MERCDKIPNYGIDRGESGKNCKQIFKQIFKNILQDLSYMESRMKEKLGRNMANGRVQVLTDERLRSCSARNEKIELSKDGKPGLKH